MARNQQMARPGTASCVRLVNGSCTFEPSCALTSQCRPACCCDEVSSCAENAVHAHGMPEAHDPLNGTPGLPVAFAFQDQGQSNKKRASTPLLLEFLAWRRRSPKTKKVAAAPVMERMRQAERVTWIISGLGRLGLDFWVWF